MSIDHHHQHTCRSLQFCNCIFDSHSYTYASNGQNYHDDMIIDALTCAYNFLLANALLAYMRNLSSLRSRNWCEITISAIPTQRTQPLAPLSGIHTFLALIINNFTKYVLYIYCIVNYFVFCRLFYFVSFFLFFLPFCVIHLNISYVATCQCIRNPTSTLYSQSGSSRREINKSPHYNVFF